MEIIVNPFSPARRRHLLRLAATCLAGVASVPRAQQADTLRVLVGYPPGGNVDLVARALARHLAGTLASSVPVENKPGAAGRLAAEDVKLASPGSALLVTPASVMTMYPHVYRQLAYDPLRDFTPVSTVAATGFVLAVGPGVPIEVTSLANLVAWMREVAAPVACGNAGAGSMPHFLSLMLARQLGVSINPVPYRGGQAAVQATAAGEVPMALGTESAARAFGQGGRLRVLATSWARRSPFFPDVPTFQEQGVNDLVVREWFGLFMPAATPSGIVQAVADSVRATVARADVRETFDRLAVMAESSTPVELRNMLRDELAAWGPRVKAAGFTPEG